jgi:hypothetical protein
MRSEKELRQKSGTQTLMMQHRARLIQVCKPKLHSLMFMRGSADTISSHRFIDKNHD